MIQERRAQPTNRNIPFIDKIDSDKVVKEEIRHEDGKVSHLCCYQKSHQGAWVIVSV